ncbi:bacteriohemerythrin [Geomonas sp. Red32]|uniref:bacteriohemerythrin n=1 Tax=Geomonas sp. Red32 TaxID=2912856 RepID=UPI00202CD821|nr:bacteriohemerythrin [Geomonas sp. Red32]MCM0080174.1 bacteriohemerythrin [Geomonas sp. Red32]
MAMIKWNFAFVVGIEEVDRHHRHLVDLLNKGYSQLNDDASPPDLRPLLIELVDYANYHFACEEGWMASAGYPDLPRHRKEHALFTERVLALTRRHQEEKEVTLETLNFIHNWITHHILEVDVEFADFVKVWNLTNKIQTHTLTAG